MSTADIVRRDCSPGWVRAQMPILELQPPYKSARFELCYLLKEDMEIATDSIGANPNLVNRDELMFHQLRVMKEESKPAAARTIQQFTDTLAALERMFKAVGRTMPENVGQAARGFSIPGPPSV